MLDVVDDRSCGDPSARNWQYQMAAKALGQMMSRPWPALMPGFLASDLG